MELSSSESIPESQASISTSGRPQRVRIQVGLSQSSNDYGRRASLPTAQETAAAAAAAAATALPYAATTRLFDLCDSAFMSKRFKRSKRSKGDRAASAVSSYARAGGGSAAAAAAAAGGGGVAMVSQGTSQGSSQGSLHAVAARLRRQSQGEETRKATGPQVEFVNGNIVLKESSLVLPEPTAEGEYEELEEGAHATATYFSFLKRKPGSKWGFEETWLFYKALRQCGTEFSLMQSFFPGRTRKQLKQKYLREEKDHPELIRRSLDRSLPLELEPFRAQFGKNILPTKVASSRQAGAGAAGGGGSKAKAGNSRGRGSAVAVGAVVLPSNGENTVFIPVPTGGRTAAGALSTVSSAPSKTGTAALVAAAAAAEEVTGARGRKRKDQAPAVRPSVWDPSEDKDEDLYDV